MDSARSRNIPLTIATACIFFFLFAPLAIVALFSFQDSQSLTLPFHGFSTRWYEVVFNDSELQQALFKSLTIGAVTSVVVLILGTAAAYGLGRARPGRWKWALAILFFVPITVPGIFLGLSLFTLFSQAKVELSMGTILIAHCVYTFPVFFIVARLAMDRLDPALEESAADLGASRFTAFWRVVFPNVWPVLAGAAALAFMFSFDEFIVTYFVAGNEQTLPLYVFGKLRREIDPTINVISTLLLTLTIATVFVAYVLISFGNRRQRRREGVLTSEEGTG